MSAVDILISQMVAQALANRTGYRMPGHMTLLAMKFISIVSAAAGAGLLMAALYIWLGERYLLQQTLVFMSAILFFVSLCAVAISATVLSIRKRAVRRVGHDFVRTTSEIYEGVVSEIGDPLKDHHGVALVAAALAGLYIGRKF